MSIFSLLGIGVLTRYHEQGLLTDEEMKMILENEHGVEELGKSQKERENLLSFYGPLGQSNKGDS